MTVIIIACVEVSLFYVQRTKNDPSTAKTLQKIYKQAPRSCTANLLQNNKMKATWSICYTSFVKGKPKWYSFVPSNNDVHIVKKSLPLCKSSFSL